MIASSSEAPPSAWETSRTQKVQWFGWEAKNVKKWNEENREKKTTPSLISKTKFLKEIPMNTLW